MLVVIGASNASTNVEGSDVRVADCDECSGVSQQEMSSVVPEPQDHSPR